MMIPMILFLTAQATRMAMPPLPPAHSSLSHPVTWGDAETGRMTPADLLQSLDDFRAGLSAGDRARLDRALPRDADGGIASCDAGAGSRASCEAAAYMPALRRTGLMPRFLTTICAKTATIGAGDPNDRSAPAFIPPR